MRPAANGSYAFRDLPPGNYFIAAVTDMEPADLADPAYIEALLPAALPVRLQLGERTIQDLRLAR